MSGIENEKRRMILKWGAAATMIPIAGCGGDGSDGGPGAVANAASTLASTATADTASVRVPDGAALRLSYSQAAGESNILFEGLPLGNGRLGALTGGSPAREALYLNEITLWSGQKDAVDLAYTAADMGSYQMLGKLYVDLPGHAQASGYSRSLDISNAVARTQYVAGGHTYRREVFCSHPDKVLVMRLSSDGGSHDGTISLVDGQGASVTGSNGILLAQGKLDGVGERYATHVLAMPDSGTVKYDASKGVLTMSRCPALTLIIAARTNYSGIEAEGYLGATDPAALARADVSGAAHLPYRNLLERHLRDYTALFGRFSLDLGKSSDAQRAMTIPDRLKARTASPDIADPELEALYVQFGRYLTIASSRGPLPANLQGLWSVNNTPPWMADYHTDINVQMNYWLADRAGLPECQKPFADYVLSQLPSWERSTQAHFNDAANSNYSNSSGKVAGWTIAISTGIYGGIGWDWSPPASAWYCRTLWNHYQYTLDRDYLRAIYPVLKSACEFWQARLIVDPASGLLVDDRDWSPEHGDHQELGITYAQELVWDLFTNYGTASGTLNLDTDFAATIAGLRSRLYLPKISPTTGQLQEWMEDKVDTGDPQHRHLSPLIGWFEGERIAYDGDPALVAAAKALLTARGTDSFGWGLAWRIACWAKFRDAATCYSMVQKLLRFASGSDSTNGTFTNMFDAYGGNIFQIDANFGGPAAILEMLVQSSMDSIVLLPALPPQWNTGSVKGVRVKGGFSVDLAWKDGKLTSAAITSVGGTGTTLKYGSISKPIVVRALGRSRFDGALGAA
ncbi:glycosyl hydrolase family 95 catalytic domain-containing protein [Burkholderia gladioli]|uniref:glycoside hydrolase family 95 protein n=1 Tax=Burkholderia gladioli TaxID=28095 RepID=UPI003F78EF9A